MRSGGEGLEPHLSLLLCHHMCSFCSREERAQWGSPVGLLSACALLVSRPRFHLVFCCVFSVCQAAQTAPPPPPPPPPPPAPEQQTVPPPGSPSGGTGSPGGLGLESLSPEFFTSVVQGVLNSLLGSLGARAGSSESIAAFIQRLSGSSNIFEPGADGALGEPSRVPWSSPGRGD